MILYDEYKPSGIDWIGKIPSRWELKRIKNIADICRGASPRPIDDERYFDENGKFAWVRISDVTDSNMYLLKTEETLSELGSSCSVKISKDDLFVSIAGSVGKPIISKIDACIHDGFIWLKTPKCNVEYLFYLLLTEGIYGGLGKLGTQLNLNTQIIGNIKIPFPSQDEQVAVAEYLHREINKNDSLINNKKIELEKLKELRQIEINNAVTRGLNPNVELKESGIEWIRKIPKHWQVNRLKNVAYINEEVISEKMPSDYEIKYIDIGNVNSNGEIIELQYMQFEDAPSRARRKVKDRSIILSTVRTYLRAISFLSNPDPNIIVSTGFAVIDSKPNLLFAKYLYYCIMSHFFIENVIASSEGVSYPAISSAKLESFHIPIPPVEEQIETAKYLEVRLSKIDTLIVNIEKQIEKLEELRKIKIHEAVTGKIKVS